MKKQVLVTVDRGETRVAMMEAAGNPSSPKDTKKGARPKAGNTPAGYRVAEIYFERRGSRSIVGNIYKGKVDNVLPGLEAAFVDIGLDKNGFLHVDEIVLPGVDRVQRGRGSGGASGTRIISGGTPASVSSVRTSSRAWTTPLVIGTTARTPGEALAVSASKRFTLPPKTGQRATAA